MDTDTPEDNKTTPLSEKSSCVADKPPFSLPHEIAFVALVTSAQLITQSALGQAIAPLHVIGRHFGVTNPGELSWYAAGYSLTVGTFILIAGRLGDMYGHRNMFISGYFWLALWSLLAGVSYYPSSSTFFIVCRTMQGIGPAFLLPNALAILGRTYPPGKRKNIAFSIFGGLAPGGFTLGAVFSSMFAQWVIWAWAYWVLAIVCAVLATLSLFIIPGRSADEIAIGRSERFDYLGSIAGVTGLVLVNVAWNQGPNVGWDSAYVIVFLIVGLLIIGLFFYIETRVTHPILPLDILTRPACFVLTCIAAGWSSFGIWVYFSWQFMELLRSQSPLLSSAQTIPTAISGMCAALVTGYLMRKIPTTAIMAMAMMFFCVASILLATMPVHQTYWANLFVSFLIACWGMDMSFPAGTLIMSASVPRKHQGIAASLINTVVNYSISIGLGLAGTVEVHVNKNGSDLLSGYRGAWYLGIGLSGMGLVISLVKLLREYLQARKEAR